MGRDDGDDVTFADLIRTYNEPIEWTFMKSILISLIHSPLRYPIFFYHIII